MERTRSAHLQASGVLVALTFFTRARRNFIAMKCIPNQSMFGLELILLLLFDLFFFMATTKAIFIYSTLTALRNVYRGYAANPLQIGSDAHSFLT